MKHFKKILLVSREGANEQATLARAVELAKQNQARLTLVAVVEELPRELRLLITAMPPSELRKHAIEQQRDRLKTLVAPLLEDGVRVSATVLYGTPFLEIIREVLRKKHDLVLVTAEGAGGVKERLFGSTSLHLMRKCPCPVWAMKPSRRRRYSRILAAVDPDPADAVRTALNGKILELATALAAQEKSELHVVHVARPADANLYRGDRIRISKQQVAQMNRTVRNHARKNVGELLEAYPLKNLKHRIHVSIGEARALLPKLVQRERIDLVVMGTVCRTGIPGFLIGNTAESVLQHVDCSVLTVKPAGFVTPVTL